MREAAVSAARLPAGFSLARGHIMETDWYNRAEAIQQRITQLKDSL
jgi:hypothetical protein